MAKQNALIKQKGWIEVIAGPMFAGKSEALIRKLHHMEFAEVNYLIFKPKIDTRTSEFIKSRNGNLKPALCIDNPEEILVELMNSNKIYNVIAIDECQFFDMTLVDVCDLLASKGYIVLVAGLDCNFRGEPFGPIPNLLTKAEKIDKMTAICSECGAEATRSQRLINGCPASYDEAEVLIGNTESYSPRCRHCHIIPNTPMTKTSLKFYQFNTGKLNLKK